MNPLSRVTVSKPPHIQNDDSLNPRLSKAKALLEKNNFPELNFSVHYKIDWAPTIVLTGMYESSQDKDLFALLDSPDFKRLLPESVVVEWMYGDKDFPGKTFLESHPNYQEDPASFEPRLVNV